MTRPVGYEFDECATWTERGRTVLVATDGSLSSVDPKTGEVEQLPFERQAELVMEQMKICLEAAGSSLTRVIKCNVYCTPDPSHYGRFNAIYDRYFTTESPARIFLHVPSHSGPFDIEIDCVATV